LRDAFHTNSSRKPKNIQQHVTTFLKYSFSLTPKLENLHKVFWKHTRLVIPEAKPTNSQSLAVDHPKYNSQTHSTTVISTISPRDEIRHCFTRYLNLAKPRTNQHWPWHTQSVRRMIRRWRFENSAGWKDLSLVFCWSKKGETRSEYVVREGDWDLRRERAVTSVAIRR
jgi:hypothetical protein